MLVPLGCQECVLSSNLCFMLNAFCHSISKVIAVVRDTIEVKASGISGERNESKVQLHTVKFHSRILYLWQTYK